MSLATPVKASNVFYVESKTKSWWDESKHTPVIVTVTMLLQINEPKCYNWRENFFYPCQSTCQILLFAIRLP